VGAWPLRVQQRTVRETDKKKRSTSNQSSAKFEQPLRSGFMEPRLMTNTTAPPRDIQDLDLGLTPDTRTWLNSQFPAPPTAGEGARAWRFLAGYLAAAPSHADVAASDMSFSVPRNEAFSRPEAVMLLWSLRAVTLHASAIHVGMMATRDVLGVLGGVLDGGGGLVSVAVLARALLEHAADTWHAAHLGRLSKVRSLWRQGEGRPCNTLGEPDEAALTVIVNAVRVAYRSLFGTRFNWEVDGEVPIALSTFKKLKTKIPDFENKTSVITAIETAEKELGITGLAMDYERLCDAAHPSRGSRELLSFGRGMSEQGDEAVRRFSNEVPSSANRVQKLKVFVVPALRGTVECLRNLAEHLVPMAKEHGDDYARSLEAFGLGPEEEITTNASMPASGTKPH
jgi:hypothetical protein